ncbi:MFS transporter [Bradyrhizobium mercantei]|uniref:MFS transporter n=1 Tax=Bradyrhizobium mercantei TaxID=1904807 RepID=UPI0009788528|nr:aromatic acid/H+ symport family MFS transporter [Bradyrhizobium mercantei]
MGANTDHMQKRWIDNRVLVPVLCGLVQVLDGYDLATVGFAVPSIAREWGLAPEAFTQAFAFSSIGIMIGALVAGPLGDRFGRRPMILISVLLFGLSSLATAHATSVWMLVVLRFLTGLGMGGAMPTTVALTGDAVPEKWRTAAITFMFCGASFGSFAAGQVAAMILPSWGWQGMFLTGGALPLAIFPVLFALLQESSAFRASAKTRNPIGGLFQNGLAATTLLLWSIFLANLFTMYLLGAWVPTFITLDGTTPAEAAHAASFYPVAGMFSTFLVGYALSRFNAERVLAANLAIAVIALIFLGKVHFSGFALCAMLFAMGWGIVGSMLGLIGLAGTLYPAHLRATGTGWAMGVGRLGGILGPIAGGTLIHAGYAPSSIMLLLACPTAAVVLAILMLRRVRGAGDVRETAEDPQSQLALERQIGSTRA